MPRFRKKPVVIDAMQLDDSFDTSEVVCAWIRDNGGILMSYSTNMGRRTFYELSIETLEGTMRAVPGDWIIRGVMGEFYPCKPDIFDATYEDAEDEYGNETPQVIR